MASAFAERFMKALQQSEGARDPGPVADLFGDDAELMNLAREDPHRGREGAREFWADYLNAFRNIRSRFTHVVENEKGVALEWVSEGELPTGVPFTYRGVSLLEPDGDHVRRFRTYYDTAAFLSSTAREHEAARADHAG